jgi:hypothetical protein
MKIKEEEFVKKCTFAPNIGKSRRNAKVNQNGDA